MHQIKALNPWNFVLSHGLLGFHAYSKSKYIVKKQQLHAIESTCPHQLTYSLLIRTRLDREQTDISIIGAISYISLGHRLTLQRHRKSIDVFFAGNRQFLFVTQYTSNRS